MLPSASPAAGSSQRAASLAEVVEPVAAQLGLSDLCKLRACAASPLELRGAVLPLLLLRLCDRTSPLAPAAGEPTPESFGGSAAWSRGAEALSLGAAGPLGAWLPRPCATTRRRALAALRRLAPRGWAEVSLAALAALGDEHPTVRLEAVRALGEVAPDGDVAACERLAQAGSGDPDRYVRRAAVDALAEHAGRAAASGVVVASRLALAGLEVLSEDADGTVRRAAAEALRGASARAGDAGGAGAPPSPLGQAGGE